MLWGLFEMDLGLRSKSQNVRKPPNDAKIRLPGLLSTSLGLRVGLGWGGLFRVGFVLVSVGFRVGFKASLGWDLGLCKKVDFKIKGYVYGRLDEFGLVDLPCLRVGLTWLRVA